MFNVARYAFRYSRVIINTSLTTLAPFITQPTNIYGSGHYTVNGPLNADIDAPILYLENAPASSISLLKVPTGAFTL